VTQHRITIVDYGLGNLASIANMLKRIGAGSILASTPEQLREATSLILPGVGAFGKGMQNLHERGLVDALTRKAIDEKVPVLGLCLGMQLLVSSSEEASVPGLGWIEGRCVRFSPTGLAPEIRIPHMGWNRVTRRTQHPLFDDLGPDARSYFVHAYHLVDVHEEDQLGSTDHGVRFPSVVARGNLMGVQFHPEKSHRFGMSLMRSFARMSGAI
jgi:glutamine amidotransferase